MQISANKNLIADLVPFRLARKTACRQFHFLRASGASSLAFEGRVLSSYESPSMYDADCVRIILVLFKFCLGGSYGFNVSPGSRISMFKLQAAADGMICFAKRCFW